MVRLVRDLTSAKKWIVWAKKELSGQYLNMLGSSLTSIAKAKDSSSRTGPRQCPASSWRITRESSHIGLPKNGAYRDSLKPRMSNSDYSDCTVILWPGAHCTADAAGEICRAAETSHKEESLAWPSNLLVWPGLEWAAGIHGSGPRSSFCIANSRCKRGTHKAVYGPNSADEQFDKAKDAIQKILQCKHLLWSYLQEVTCKVWCEQLVHELSSKCVLNWHMPVLQVERTGVRVQTLGSWHQNIWKQNHL